MFDHRGVRLEVDDSLEFVDQRLECYRRLCRLTFDAGKKPCSNVCVAWSLETADEHQALELVDLQVLKLELFTRPVDFATVADDVFRLGFHQLQALVCLPKIFLSVLMVSANVTSFGSVGRI